MVRRDVDLFPNLAEMAQCKASLSVSVSDNVNYFFSKWVKLAKMVKNTWQIIS
jgi:hypothetical protein